MKILSAKHIKDYTIECVFEDKKIVNANFEGFLRTTKLNQLKKFLEPKNFKNFSIQYGSLCWGNNEFDINPESIYAGEFSN